MAAVDESHLLAAARAGDRDAFTALVTPHLVALRSFLNRMCGSPDDGEDLVQDTLVKAFERISGFRGEAAFKTWLFRIGSNTALDHLRHRSRWREDAQDRARAAAMADPGFADAARAAAAAGPAGTYEMREHVSYCFTCIAKSLPAEQQAALLLRDVYELSNDEGAAVLDTTTAAFKHFVHDARARMQAIFAGRCALVSKTGVCWQCTELAELFDRGARDGLDGTANRRPHALTPPLRIGDDYAARLAVVRANDPMSGVGRDLHAFLARHLRRVEGEG